MKRLMLVLLCAAGVFEASRAAHAQKPKEPVIKPRVWTSAVGEHEITARLKDVKLVLVSSAGKEILVPLGSLSDADRRYISNFVKSPLFDKLHPKPAESGEAPAPPTDLARAPRRELEPPPEENAAGGAPPEGWSTSVGQPIVPGSAPGPEAPAAQTAPPQPSESPPAAAPAAEPPPIVRGSDPRFNVTSFDSQHLIGEATNTTGADIAEIRMRYHIIDESTAEDVDTGLFTIKNWAADAVQPFRAKVEKPLPKRFMLRLEEEPAEPVQ